jgi:hypothetical protein
MKLKILFSASMLFLCVNLANGMFYNKETNSNSYFST